MALTWHKCTSTGHGYLHTQLATFQPKLRTCLHGRVLDCHKIHRILDDDIVPRINRFYFQRISLNQRSEESILNLLLKIRLLKKTWKKIVIQIFTVIHRYIDESFVLIRFYNKQPFIFYRIILTNVFFLISRTFINERFQEKKE